MEIFAGEDGTGNREEGFLPCRTCRACRVDRNVFSHKEHIGHKEGYSFAEATEDKTGNGGGVEEGKSGMVGEWLAPGIGAVEDAVAAPSVWNDIGQLALRRKITGDVTVVRGVVSKPRLRFPWI